MKFLYSRKVSIPPEAQVTKKVVCLHLTSLHPNILASLALGMQEVDEMRDQMSAQSEVPLPGVRLAQVSDATCHCLEQCFAQEREQSLFQQEC